MPPERVIIGGQRLSADSDTGALVTQLDSTSMAVLGSPAQAGEAAAAGKPLKAVAGSGHAITCAANATDYIVDDASGTIAVSEGDILALSAANGTLYFGLSDLSIAANRLAVVYAGQTALVTMPANGTLRWRTTSGAGVTGHVAKRAQS